MTEDPRVLLRKVSFCADLPEAAVAGLAAIATSLQYPAGALIQLEGDPANAMYVVGRGRVKIARVGANATRSADPGRPFDTIRRTRPAYARPRRQP